MDLVVDANILFAALIKEGATSDLLFKDSLHLFAPEFLLVEFEKYRKLIKVKTNRSDAEFDKLIGVLDRRISFVPLEEIRPFIETAIEITPDEKDAPYLALALRLDIPVWSNDRALKEKQDVVRVFSTHDLLKL